MTTPTTDAEAIRDALGVLRIKWRGHDDARIDDASIDEAVTAILSYLASRREAQEPVAHPKIMYVCECCYEHNPEACGHDRRDIYVTPDGKWLCENCIDAEDTPSRDCVSPPPLYTAPPAPAGEVERLRRALKKIKSLLSYANQNIVTPAARQSNINSAWWQADAALNGGRADG